VNFATDEREIIELSMNMTPTKARYTEQTKIKQNFTKDLIFLTNSEIHTICTRHTANLHPPLLHLTKAQKGLYFSAIKIYNFLPQRIKKLSGDANIFKVTLKKFLLLNSFYSLEEYFAYDTKSDPDKN
jgi:hypothetical protein